MGRCAYHISPHGRLHAHRRVRHGGSGADHRRAGHSERRSQGAGARERNRGGGRSDGLADLASLVRQWPASLMAWCERFAAGVHVQCANEYALHNGDDDCKGTTAPKTAQRASALLRLLVGAQALHDSDTDGDDWTPTTSRRGTARRPKAKAATPTPPPVAAAPHHDIETAPSRVATRAERSLQPQPTHVQPEGTEPQGVDPPPYSHS